MYPVIVSPDISKIQSHRILDKFRQEFRQSIRLWHSRLCNNYACDMV